MPSPAAGTLRARLLRAAFKALRRLNVGPFAALSDDDLAGHAHGLDYAMRATRWLRGTGAAGWPELNAAWSRGTAAWGTLAPEDRWELVTDNAQAFALRDRLLAQAQHTVDLSTFYFTADATGLRVARALAECARRGVRVRLLADGWAVRGKAFQDPQVFAAIRMLRAAGVDCRLFSDPQRPFDACHRKLLLVDGRTLLVGGRNHADHYAGTQWRDVELLLTGPAAAAAQASFDEAFTGEPGRHAAAGAAQPTTPRHVAHNAWFTYLLHCARTARRSLDIENAYWFQHPAVQEEVAAACRRGVRVRVLTNSAHSNDLSFMNHRLVSGFGPLLASGAQLWLREGKGRTLHGKYFVADGEWVGFGTSNLDFYSPRFCLELGLHLRDRALGGALGEYFAQGLQDAQRLASAEGLRGDAVSRLFDRWFPDIQ